jgi:5-formyltetrahydrofolate cyclo-ligase
MTSTPARTSRQALRRELRRQRRQISETRRTASALQLAANAGRDRLVLNSRHIAVYLPSDGEIDPQPLMHYLWSLGKRLYLPVLVSFSDRRLWFSSYSPGERLVLNRFGIPEPERVHHRRIQPASLDLVLTPLVGFDDRGHRLGMGGGYYDRVFGFLNRRTRWKKPRLMGLAYELQRCDTLQAAAWDVNMDAVATEQAVYHFGRCNQT